MALYFECRINKNALLYTALSSPLGCLKNIPCIIPSLIQVIQVKLYENLGKTFKKYVTKLQKTLLMVYHKLFVLKKLSQKTKIL